MKRHTKSYEPPAAVRYGTVRGLTASTLKCSPGGDHALSTPYAEFGTGQSDPTHHWLGGGPLHGSPSRDSSGAYIPYDGCSMSDSG